MRFMTIRIGLITIGAAILSACGTSSTLPPERVQPLLAEGHLVTADGVRLALDRYEPDVSPSVSTDGFSKVVFDNSTANPIEGGLKAEQSHAAKAVIIALHGMNDYARTFERAGPWWAKKNIVVYAYDQRGFGRSPNPGDWPGADVLSRDLENMVMAVRARHQNVPIYIVGHSMGGAVAMIANQEHELGVDGVILAAPAIWGGNRMPLFYRMILSLASTFAPKKTLTGKRARRQATDNIPVLQGMQADPYVLKATPLASVKGIVDLMGRANKSADQQKGKILFLYGQKDEIIPLKALMGVQKTIDENGAAVLSALTYEEGWHLLFRDHQAEKVWRDIDQWIEAQLQ